MHQEKYTNPRSNLFVRYFTSFICIILIPIMAFSGFLYYFVSRRMDMELDARLESTAQALATQMDSLLVQLEGEVTRFALELEMNDLVTLLLNMEQKMQRLADLRKRLESSASTNPAIDVIGVYFGADKKVMSQRGYYPEGSELDWEPVRTLLASAQVNGIHVRQRENGTVQIIIGKSIPIQQKKGRNFVICTLRGDVLNQYAQYGWEEAGSFVLDAKGGVLASSFRGELPAGAWPDADGNTPDTGSRYRQVSSKVMPWRYVVSISQKTAGLDTNRFLWAILLIVAALSALGIGFSYLLAHVFYRPISQLAYAARLELIKIKGKEIAPTPNDIVFINQAVSAISAYGMALEQCVDSGRSRVLGSVLQHLLEGNAMAREEVHEILENYMFETAGREFTVFVAELRSGDISQKWDGWIARYQLESCMRNAIGSQEGCEALAVEMEKYRLCGIISRPVQETTLAQELFQQILTQLSQSWPYARLAIGGTVRDLMEISGPYAKAIQAIAGAPASQDKGIVDAASQAEKEKGVPGLQYWWLESITNNILVEDWQAVEQMVHEWFSRMVMTDNATLAALQEAALQMIAYLSVVLKERMPEVTNWPVPISLESAARFLHPKEVRLSVQHFCKEAIACIQQETQQHGGGKILQAVQYVDTHYMQDISLTQVSDLMEITPQYLSSTFKAQVGKNFTEYINQKRLEEASRMLKETSQPVQQISEQVGYNSVQYFARKFKESFGITPTQYRDSSAVDR